MPPKTPRQKPFHLYSTRLETFNGARFKGAKGRARKYKWPHEKPSAEDLSLNGFYFTPENTPTGSDLVTCYMCGCSIDEWTTTDDPVDAHYQNSPRCPVAVLQAKPWWKVDSKTGKDIFSKEHDPWHELSLFTRLQTFYYPLSMEEKKKLIEVSTLTGINETFREMGKSCWPYDTDKDFKPNSYNLARAGFFLSSGDYGETCTCPYCGLSLDGWEPNDDPITEHIRRSPSCHYFTCSTAQKNLQAIEAQNDLANTSHDSKLELSSDFDSDVDISAKPKKSRKTSNKRKSALSSSDGESEPIQRKKRTKRKKDTSAEAVEARKQQSKSKLRLSAFDSDNEPSIFDKKPTILSTSKSTSKTTNDSTKSDTKDLESKPTEAVEPTHKLKSLKSTSELLKSPTQKTPTSTSPQRSVSHNVSSYEQMASFSGSRVSQIGSVSEKISKFEDLMPASPSHNQSGPSSPKRSLMSPRSPNLRSSVFLGNKNTSPSRLSGISRHPNGPRSPPPPSAARLSAIMRSPMGPRSPPPPARSFRSPIVGSNNNDPFTSPGKRQSVNTLSAFEQALNRSQSLKESYEKASSAASALFNNRAATIHGKGDSPKREDENQSSTTFKNTLKTSESIKEEEYAPLPLLPSFGNLADSLYSTLNKSDSIQSSIDGIINSSVDKSENIDDIASQPVESQSKEVILEEKSEESNIHTEVSKEKALDNVEIKNKTDTTEEVEEAEKNINEDNEIAQIVEEDLVVKIDDEESDISHALDEVIDSYRVDYDDGSNKEANTDQSSDEEDRSFKSVDSGALPLPPKFLNDNISLSSIHSAADGSENWARLSGASSINSRDSGSSIHSLARVNSGLQQAALSNPPSTLPSPTRNMSPAPAISPRAASPSLKNRPVRKQPPRIRDSVSDIEIENQDPDESAIEVQKKNNLPVSNKQVVQQQSQTRSSIHQSVTVTPKGLSEVKLGPYGSQTHSPASNPSYSRSPSPQRLPNATRLGSPSNSSPKATRLTRSPLKINSMEDSTTLKNNDESKPQTASTSFSLGEISNHTEYHDTYESDVNLRASAATAVTSTGTDVITSYSDKAALQTQSTDSTSTLGNNENIKEEKEEKKEQALVENDVRKDHHNSKHPYNLYPTVSNTSSNTTSSAAAKKDLEPSLIDGVFDTVNEISLVEYISGTSDKKSSAKSRIVTDEWLAEQELNGLTVSQFVEEMSNRGKEMLVRQYNALIAKVEKEADLALTLLNGLPVLDDDDEDEDRDDDYEGDVEENRQSHRGVGKVFS